MTLQTTEDIASFLDQLVPQEKEQRRAARVTTRDEPVTLSVKLDDGSTHTGTIVNESFGGIGIVFDERIHLNREDTIDLPYKEIMSPAVVRHVSPFNDGGCMVGFEWQGLADSDRARALQQRVQENPELISSGARRFIELMPAGVAMMWQLFEHEKWVALAEVIQSMRCQVAISKIEGAKTALARAQETLLGTPKREDVRAALRAAIEDCIEGANQLFDA